MLSVSLSICYRVKDGPTDERLAGRSLERAGHGERQNHIFHLGRGEVDGVSGEERRAYRSPLVSVAT